MALFKRLCILMLLLTFMSCGDNGGGFTETTSGTETTTETETETETTSTVFEISRSARNVTGADPITITANLKIIDGDTETPVVDELVTFTSTLGVLDPTNGTALTDDNGDATIILTAGTVEGAGEVTATSQSGYVDSISFTTAGDDINVIGAINISVELLDIDGVATDSITASQPGIIRATVDGISSPVVVTFLGDVGTFPIPTAVTIDNAGVFQASTNIYAGDTLGAGVISAQISTGEIGSTIAVVGSSSVTMGSGATYTEGVAEIGTSPLSAGGTSVISVELRDDQGNLYTEPVEVNFSSGCSSLDIPSAIISSPITTSNGLVSSTYRADGCVGDDPINVTANAGGVNLSANGIINVLQASVGSIEYISATPENIGLLGTGAVGGSESSTLVFRVLDTDGNPVKDQLVNFSLNTDVGGIVLKTTSATTDTSGFVQTVVNSGTVATSIRVTAIIDGSDPEVASQSSQLVVSTGIPDQDSFTLAATIYNVEAWDRVNEETQITARLSDAFNNPVPDGTSVYFTTEGGSIEPTCQTVNGVCSVTWFSANPKPEGNVLFHVAGAPYDLVTNPAIYDTTHPAEQYNSLGQKLGGRATILATAVGEESFPDLNGNGRFDDDERTAFLGTNISGNAYDLKEAFVDHNEDGYFNPDATEAAAAPADPAGSGSLETFGPGDFNNNGSFDQKDGLYNGVLCSIPAHAGCSSQQSLNVRKSLVLVMSGSQGFITIDNTFDSPAVDDNDTTINLVGETTGSVVFTVADLHNQPMPAGTIIRASTSAGSIVSGASYTWPNDNHNGGRTLSVTVKGQADPTSGILSIESETPSGVVTQLASISIVIN